MPEFRTDHIDSIEDAEIRAVGRVFYMRPTQIITKHNGKRVRVYENNSDEDVERFKNQPDSEWENRGIGKV
jgi:CRISPR/Cas system-associated endonuclease/helicase Cas3